MEISSVCVQCSELKVCFTHFGSVHDIIDCVSSVLGVARGLPNDSKVLLSVQLMFHESFCGILVPHTYNFFLDVPIPVVQDYIRIELSNAKLI